MPLCRILQKRGQREIAVPISELSSLASEFCAGESEIHVCFLGVGYADIGDQHMKKFSFSARYISFLLSVLLFFTLSCAYLPVSGEQEIYNKILRLHVPANSDSEKDQALKLMVRDSILAELECIYSENETSSIDEAIAAVGGNLERLRTAAEQTLFENGSELGVRVSLGREYYPAKSYNEVTLPAGVYNSLKVSIGKGEGRNWWCVLYPSLCLAAATVDESGLNTYVYEEDGEKFIAAGFTADELAIITEADSKHPNIKVKFKVLEFFESLFAEK